MLFYVFVLSRGLRRERRFRGGEVLTRVESKWKWSELAAWAVYLCSESGSLSLKLSARLSSMLKRWAAFGLVVTSLFAVVNAFFLPIIFPCCERKKNSNIFSPVELFISSLSNSLEVELLLLFSFLGKFSKSFPHRIINLTRLFDTLFVRCYYAALFLSARLSFATAEAFAVLWLPWAWTSSASAHSKLISSQAQLSFYVCRLLAEMRRQSKPQVRSRYSNARQWSKCFRSATFESN